MFNWSEVHLYRSNFLQNPHFSLMIFLSILLDKLQLGIKIKCNKISCLIVMLHKRKVSSRHLLKSHMKSWQKSPCLTWDFFQIFDSVNLRGYLIWELLVTLSAKGPSINDIANFWPFLTPPPSISTNIDFPMPPP